MNECLAAQVVKYNTRALYRELMALYSVERTITIYTDKTVEQMHKKVIRWATFT